VGHRWSMAERAERPGRSVPGGRIGAANITQCN
jgi:hypothetical protein